MEPAQEVNNHDGREIAVSDSGTLSRCGYLLMAGSVVAGWAGLVNGPGAALCAYALLLLGVTFTNLAMIAPAKLKTI